jgi:F420-0:gamma-glutamyl ligase
MPLRYGVCGISIGYFGLDPFREYRQTPDLFGRVMKFSRTNMVDSLADMGVLFMGEGKEKTPILIMRGLNFINFVSNMKNCESLLVEPKIDMYRPLLKNFRKSKRK